MNNIILTFHGINSNSLQKEFPWYSYKTEIPINWDINDYDFCVLRYDVPYKGTTLLNGMINEGIDFTLVIPDSSIDKFDFIRRMMEECYSLKRISDIINDWDEILYELEKVQFPSKIIIQENERLEDVIQWLWFLK